MPDNCFTYDDSEHKYFLNTMQLTSVTQTMKLGGLIDTAWYSDGGLMRGQAVHAVLQYIAEGTLDWSSIADEIKPFVDAALKFEKENKVETILYERPLYHQIYLFAGKPDRVIILNGEVGVLDYKTGTSQAWAAIQTAAYERLVEGVDEVVKALWKLKQTKLKRWALELKNNGNYRLIEHKDRGDFNVFVSALTITNWLRVHGKGEI